MACHFFKFSKIVAIKNKNMLSKIQDNGLSLEKIYHQQSLSSSSLELSILVDYLYFKRPVSPLKNYI